MSTKIRKELKFKIKSEYYLELLITEAMKLLEDIEKKYTKKRRLRICHD